MQKLGKPSLLTLPWEIRMQILEELLRSAGPLCKVSRIAIIRREHPHDQGDIRYWRFELEGTLDLHPQVLACCRQLYTEGAPILYGNTLVVSLAVYGGFSPVDVLGYWRLEHVTGILDGTTTPIVSRFHNVEFRLYIDFEYLRGLEEGEPNAIQEVCQTLRAVKSHPFNHVKVVIDDGSWEARFTRRESQWAEALAGLTKLSYRTSALAGNIPKGVSTIEDVSALYDNTMKGTS